MKIEYLDYCCSDTQVLSVSNFVERALDGSDYERGSVEAARATANNAVEAFGRLVEFLVEQKVITNPCDVARIAGKSVVHCTFVKSK